jgi:hypothetical protein
VAEIEALIKARLEARQAKDWAAADAARNRLTEMGIIWKMARRARRGVVSKPVMPGGAYAYRAHRSMSVGRVRRSRHPAFFMPILW